MCWLCHSSRWTLFVNSIPNQRLNWFDQNQKLVNFIHLTCLTATSNYLLCLLLIWPMWTGQIPLCIWKCAFYSTVTKCQLYHYWFFSWCAFVSVVSGFFRNKIQCSHINFQRKSIENDNDKMERSCSFPQRYFEF